MPLTLYLCKNRLFTSIQAMQIMFYTLTTQVMVLMTQEHLIQFCHEVIIIQRHTHMQQIHLLTVHCKKTDDYLLFIKWKWIIIKVFILVFFTLGRLRRRREGGLAPSLDSVMAGVREEEEMEAGAGRRGSPTWCNYMETHLHFV